MSDPSINWHKRFSQQAAWTKPLRDFLIDQAGLSGARQVLEVGCGTGALLSEMGLRFGRVIFGLDINPEHLAQAALLTPQPRLTQADARALPFPNNSFDVTFCHFLLLWIPKPLQVIQEMARLTRPGGFVLACAEPDYGGRIDYPFELERAGKWQQESLSQQGADPLIGRQLMEIFTQAKLLNIQTGLFGGEWKADSLREQGSEWEVLEHDLSYLPQGWNQAQVEALKRIDHEAVARRSRIMYVPTFYAWGRK